MTDPLAAASGPHILIVGGGASGVLMAAHLLQNGHPGLKVSLIERGERLGCGIAYATSQPEHLLNTRISQMSAFPEIPGHFAAWLAEGGARPEAVNAEFVSRGTYGHYLADLIAPRQVAQSPAGAGALVSVQGEVLRLHERPEGIEAELADGRWLMGDLAILATGHAVPIDPPAPLRGAWDFTPPATPEARVAIIGTGLSMIDHAATLLAAGHKGPIIALSRRALLPLVHAATTPLPLGRLDLPIGAPVSQILKWLRGKAREAEGAGGSWRDAVDAIRPHVADIWQGWSRADRIRFLRHGATFWEVHRHRMPPVSAARIAEARASGQLQVLRAGFRSAKPLAEGGIALEILRRGGEEVGAESLIVDHLIDCRGIRRDPVKDATPVVRDLLERGAARLDPLALGLDTTRGARVLDAAGRASKRIHAIGPSARGAIWEITAIPDIRLQTAELARELMERFSAETA